MAQSTFPFEGPRQYLEKAERELTQLDEAVGPETGIPDETQIADLTMNAAWTLWHVTDWIANNATDPRCERIVASKGITAVDQKDRLRDFQKALRRESPDLRHCWELATLFKHFALEPGTRRHGRIHKVYGSTAISASLIRHGVDEQEDASIIGAVTLSAVGPAPELRTLHPKIMDGDQSLRLTEIYYRAYGYLDGLLREQGL